MNQTTREAWKGVGMRYGIMAGGICVTLFAICYFLDHNLVLEGNLWFGSLIIYVVAMWRAQSSVESDEFKDLIQPGFLVFIIANILFYLYYHLLLTVFDTSLVDVQLERWVAADNDPKDFAAPTLLATLNTYAQSLLGGFAIAAMLAAIIRYLKRS